MEMVNVFLRCTHDNYYIISRPYNHFLKMKDRLLEKKEIYFAVGNYLFLITEVQLIKLKEQFIPAY